MILDDVYSNVDKETQSSITGTLNDLAETTLLIQLFFRKRDLLPCIEKVLSVNGNNEIIKDEDADSFRRAQSQDINPHFSGCRRDMPKIIPIPIRWSNSVPYLFITPRNKY